MVLLEILLGMIYGCGVPCQRLEKRVTIFRLQINVIFLILQIFRQNYAKKSARGGETPASWVLGWRMGGLG